MLKKYISKKKTLGANSQLKYIPINILKRIMKREALISKTPITNSTDIPTPVTYFL